MKKHFFAFVCVLTVSPILAFASTQDHVSAAVSVSPAQLFLLSLDGKMLFKLSDRLALMVPAAVQFVPNANPFPLRNVFFVSGGTGIRYQLTGDDVLRSGFFVEGSLAVAYAEKTPKNRPSDKSVSARPTATVGYTWAFDNGLGFNIAGGAFFSWVIGVDAVPSLNEGVVDINNYPVLAKIETDLLVRQGFQTGFSPTGEASLSYAW